MAQSVVAIVFLFGTGVQRAQELWLGQIDGPAELPAAQQARSWCVYACIECTVVHNLIKGNNLPL